MNATPDLQHQASDPGTPPADLAALAAAHPELQPAIALNPSAYDGLLDWLRQYGDADVQSALEQRGRAADTTPPPPPPVVTAPPAPAFAPAGYGAPARRFVEPSRSVPVGYLNHDLRYTLALVAVGVAGLLETLIIPAVLPVFTDAIYFSSTGFAETGFTVALFLFRLLPWFLLGAAVFVLPSLRQNKILALSLVGGPILIQLLLMLLSVLGSGSEIATYTAVRILSFLSLLFPAAAIAAWLAVRMRPGVAFALLPITLLPIAAEYFTGGLYGGYFFGRGSTPVAVVAGILSVGVLVGIAWLARLIAASKATAPTPAERAAWFEAQQHAARVAHLQQWQAAAAHAAAYGGGAPAPGVPVAPDSPTMSAAPPSDPPTPPA